MVGFAPHPDLPLNPPDHEPSPDHDFRSFFAADEWERLLATARVLDVDSGTIILRRDAAGGRLLLVESGVIEAVETRTQPETVLYAVGPGGVLGELSVADGRRPSADVRAQSPARLLTWPIEPLREQMRLDVALAASFYRAIAVFAALHARAANELAVVVGEVRGRIAPEGGDDGVVDAFEARFDSARRNGDAAELAEVFLGLSRWYIGAPAARAHAVSQRLRADLGPVLRRSGFARTLLEREPRSAFRVDPLTAPADGADGELLDLALRSLPTLRGWEWRAQQALVEVGACTRPLVVSHGPSAVAAALPGATRVGLGDISRGWQPALGYTPDVVVLDGAADLLPDGLLIGLLGWAVRAIGPQGRFIASHGLPGPDGPLLEHLFDWPDLPRRPAALAALLPPGRITHLPPPGDTAAGVLVWEP